MNSMKVYFCDTVAAASQLATQRHFGYPYLGINEVKRIMNRVGVFLLRTVENTL